MKNQINLLLIFILTISLFSGDLFARRGKGSERGIMFKELNLTKDQKAKLRTMRDVNHDQMEKTRNEKDQLQEELRAGFKQDLSNKKLLAIHDKIIKLKISRDTVRFEKMLSIREILTKEQREKFNETHSKHYGKRGKHKGMRGNGDGEMRGRRKGQRGERRNQREE